MSPTDRHHLAVVGAPPDAELSSRPVASGQPGVHAASPRMAEEPERLLQVGELAKATGKTVRAIHLYESLGLLSPARRSKGRYRLFSTDAKARISWISKLQSLGLSLTEIQEIAAQRLASESARRAAGELVTVYEEKLSEVRQRLEHYRQLEEELESSLLFLETCRTCCEHSSSEANCTSCQRHSPEGAHPPELVTGAPFGGA